MAYTTRVNAVYEAEPQVPRLTLQTEFIPTMTSSSILTQEVPYRSRTPILKEVPHRSQTPIVQQIAPKSPIPQQTAHTVRFQSPSTDDSDSSSDEFGASVESSESEDGLIPKPVGENERPNRGGYNLELALNWDKQRFSDMKVRKNSFFSPQVLTFTLEIRP